MANNNLQDGHPNEVDAARKASIRDALEVAHHINLGMSGASLLSTGYEAEVGSDGFTNDDPIQIYRKVGSGDTEWRKMAHPTTKLAVSYANIADNEIIVVGPALAVTTDNILCFLPEGAAYTGAGHGWLQIPLTNIDGELIVNIQLEDTGSITLPAGTLALNSSGQLILHTGSADGDVLTPITGGGGGGGTLEKIVEFKPLAISYNVSTGGAAAVTTTVQFGTPTVSVGSGFKLKSDTVSLNTGSAWDTTNHKFVAPETALYEFVLPNFRCYPNTTGKTIGIHAVILGVGAYTMNIDESTSPITEIYNKQYHGRFRLALNAGEEVMICALQSSPYGALPVGTGVTSYSVNMFTLGNPTCPFTIYKVL